MEYPLCKCFQFSVFVPGKSEDFVKLARTSPTAHLSKVPYRATKGILAQLYSLYIVLIFLLLKKQDNACFLALIPMGSAQFPPILFFLSKRGIHMQSTSSGCFHTHILSGRATAGAERAGTMAAI